MESESAGARGIQGWEQLVKTTASKVIGKKLIVCNRAVKWWDEEVKEVTRPRRERTQDMHRVRLRQHGRSMLQLEIK